MSTQSVNAGTLRDYNQWLKDSDRRLQTRENHRYWLEELTRHTGKLLTTITVEDIVEYLRAKKETTGKGTRNIIRSVFRVFFRDFLNTPEPINHLIMKKEKVTRKQKRPPNDEEEDRLITATQNVRDKALLAVMLEGGLRRSVFAKWKPETYDKKAGPPYLQYSDVRRDKEYPNGFVIRIRKSKTSEEGEWDCPIYRYAWALKLWLAHHPTKDPRDPLFCYQKRGEVFPLSSIAVYKLVKAAVRRAGLDSSVHPHLLRKRAATKKKELGMDDYDIAQTSGWKEGSQVLYTYLQQNPEVARKKYAEAIGMKPKEKRPPTEEKYCLSCGEKLSTKASICPNCWLPVDKTAADILVEAAREGRKAAAQYQEEMDFLKQQLAEQQKQIEELQQFTPYDYCPDCEEPNPIYFNKCVKCGKPLNPEERLNEFRESEELVDGVIRYLVAHPESLVPIKKGVRNFRVFEEQFVNLWQQRWSSEIEKDILSSVETIWDQMAQEDESAAKYVRERRKKLAKYLGKHRKPKKQKS